MARPVLLVAGALGLAAAASFAFVAARLGRQARGPEGGHIRYFQLWWGAVAAYAFLSVFLIDASAGLDVVDARVFTVARSLSILLLCLAIWGLGTFVAYLYSGSEQARFVIGAYAIAAYVFGVGTFALSAPSVVSVGTFGARIVLSPAPDARATALFVALITLPQVVSALAYLGLALRVQDPKRRYRVLLVGAGLLAWGLAGAVAGANVDSAAMLLRPALGVLAGSAVVLAYAPPAWVERRLAATSGAGGALSAGPAAPR